MKPFTHSLLLAFITLLFACGNKQITGNKEQSDSQAKPAHVAEEAIPFTQAKNYFVRNDYRDSVTHLLKLESRDAFDRVFGMAATMSPDGKPTPINFDTHYVLACISKSNDKSIELQVASLVSNEGSILLTCSSKEGPAQTFISRSALILMVEKHHQGNPKLKLR